MNSVSKTLPPSGRQCETDMNFGGLVGVCVGETDVAATALERQVQQMLLFGLALLLHGSFCWRGFIID
ncbi:hypothetical protein OUZ56_030956 [Daphnia magna]|uniref:Uncharacterized protein n=1 Tax=Daphnia magna TaxID=35525 RepID=A0ABQ9ZSU2_9CRUS|nr:hypothetical protein OUZ56_030956 [Daphnia magna]